MNNRERNLMLLKKAAAGKLTADDLTYNPEDPTFDITLNLHGEKPEVSEEETRRINRLKSQGRYFNITLDLSK
jgi:hypothetical protein